MLELQHPAASAGPGAPTAACWQLLPAGANLVLTEADVDAAAAEAAALGPAASGSLATGAVSAPQQLPLPHQQPATAPDSHEPPPLPPPPPQQPANAPISQQPPLPMPPPPLPQQQQPAISEPGFNSAGVPAAMGLDAVVSALAGSDSTIAASEKRLPLSGWLPTASSSGAPSPAAGGGETAGPAPPQPGYEAAPALLAAPAGEVDQHMPMAGQQLDEAEWAEEEEEEEEQVGAALQCSCKALLPRTLPLPPPPPPPPPPPLAAAASGFPSSCPPIHPPQLGGPSEPEASLEVQFEQHGRYNKPRLLWTAELHKKVC